MIVKIYWSLWLALGLAALLLFAIGSFNVLTGVVFGFIAFGLTFMGMIGVLPTLVGNDGAHEVPPAQNVSIQLASETPAKAFNILKSA
jgi:hypothetical protein